MTTACDRIRSTFPDFLQERPGSRAATDVEDHLRACPECEAEWDAVQTSWNALPGSMDADPPARVREAILSRAGRAVEARVGVAGALLRSVRREGRPILIGVGAAALVLGGLALRGGLAPVGPATLVGKGLFLGAALAVVVTALLDRKTPSAVRSVLMGGVGALGGYVLLTMVSPIPGSVEFCRVTLLGAPPLAIHQLCLIYLVVAAVYAGLPMAAAVYFWTDGGEGMRAGLMAAGVFLVLAAPSLLLQVGLGEWVIGLTLLGGAALGSLLGAAGGSWARSRQVGFGR